MKHKKLSQSGNALWFILIAIALLGGLTVMLSRSSGTSEDTGEYEKNQISATEILRTGEALKLAVENLKSRGCSENELSFWHDSDGNGTENGSDDYYNGDAPTDHSCHIFQPEGAGLEYDTGWIITGASRVLGLGSDSRTELLAVFETSQDLCTQINDLVSVSNPSGTPPSEDFDMSAFTGGFGTTVTAGYTIGNTSAQLEEKFQSCSKDASDNYFYAHVLAER